MLVVERSPLTVDGHRGVRREVHVGELGDGAGVLHISCVTAGAEDTADLHLGVGVGRGNQGPRGVIDQGAEFDRDTLR